MERKVSAVPKDSNKLKLAVIESIEHWNKMIYWVRTYCKKGDFTDRGEMEDELGENWGGVYCSLCNCLLCCFCPVGKVDEFCRSTESSWHKVDDSETWGKWLYNAERFMLRALNKSLEYVESLEKGGGKNGTNDH